MKFQFPKGETISGFLQAANHVAQILAFGVGGLWVLWTWNQQVAPALAAGISMSAEPSSEWSEPSRACRAYVKVTIRNDGHRLVRVNQVSYRVFRASPPQLAYGVDLQVLPSVPDGETVQEGVLDGGFLTFEYAPGSVGEQFLTVLTQSGLSHELWFTITALDQHGDTLDYRTDVLPACDRDALINPTERR